MARRKLDYKEVAEAAERVKRQGREPSLINVCEELGIITPTSNLSILLERWYHTQPEFQRSVKAPLSENINVKTHDILEKNVELEKSLSLLRATLESTADGIMMVNGKGQVVDWNQKFVEMWRIPSHMLESGTESIGFEYILQQLSNPEAVIADVKYLYENPEWQGELPVLQFKDGRIFERFTQPQRIGAEIVGRVYSFRDITQKLLEEDELRIRERAIEASTHGVAILDISKPDLPIIYVNKAFERITGYSERQILGQNLSFLHGSKVEHVNHKRITLAIKELREETVELESYRRSGEVFWCEVSVAPVRDSFDNVKHYVCIINDVTQRREMEQQLIQQATHDSLTELPNRVLLIDRVDQAILLAKKKGSMLGFLFLDLDHFKMTNDTLGHSIGDRLLQAVSNRLLIATDDFDTVCRLGGDEFVVLLHDVATELQAQQKAEEILTSIAKPIQIDQHNLKITGSIGISYYPKDGDDYESLMKCADLSMYHAKDSGRNTYRTYDKEMNMRIINRMQLDNALRDSLKRKEFHLVYQPFINLATNKIIGFEALLRWHSHILGDVPPNEFIGMAEENGLILDIGMWVLREACSQLVRWHRQGYDQLTMAVNISGRQFRQAHLSEVIENILLETGLPAKFLELELTESLLVDNVKHAVETMYELKDMGTKLAIDDFGTGYSSLAYLKQFPVDKLKIDRSFISELVNRENDAAITRAIINLGHSLNLQVLAEGVETDLQRQFIMQHGCDYAQGYYFAMPQKAEDLKDFIRQHI
ncbi:EAL domain-containing protein [Fluoribacter gormanii]|uniref:cyclic-guanylate-specific phosphodiesterase n=1 Tax=Fluoribacter gormanii TaxID=464 RepID=A0A377GFS1_9GAMM|nr:bifunctional diguanylate cyclase/phosphodiesterase [Fluoribacter gormanii]KTD05254.1 regulatory protein (GGDEF and EAL domains) [Fluoribacter gormanii]MCW8444815.1 EAL domain-containing protein [Fluoribacter gormanii]MCW8470023.1 EAL domain-containing protein [Fluoribacter gormanii]SIR70144.1 PAS domain S-box-containing protein/diguanylate cyclase (GGDEF) domain-containing protein [Fluoribacter gormanii]STO23621.1 Bacteriophytochrome cph2 [Fluoribacter gormanii]